MYKILGILSFVCLLSSFYPHISDTSKKGRQIIPRDTATSTSSPNQIFDTTAGIQKEIKELLNASTSYLKKNSEDESGWDLIPDRTGRIIGTITALVALIVSILAFFKADFLTQYKPILATIAIISFSALLTFLLAGFLQLIILATLAIAIIIFLFLYLLLKYLELFDKQGYRLTEKILSYFKVDNEANKNFINVASEWLKSTIDQHIILQTFESQHEGSFIRGYDFTSFKIIPTETEDPHCKIIDNKILIPINIEIYFIKGADGERVLFKNLQFNQLVITETNEHKLTCNTFDSVGFGLLGLSLAKWGNSLTAKMMTTNQ
jgi:Ca2+/Na+ antiporter